MGTLAGRPVTGVLQRHHRPITLQVPQRRDHGRAGSEHSIRERPLCCLPKNATDGLDLPPCHRPEGDDVTGAGGDDLLTTACVDGHVAVVEDIRATIAAGEDEVAWPDLLHRNLDAHQDLLLGGPGELDADPGVGPLNQGAARLDGGQL